MRLVRPERAKESPDARTSFGQDQIQPLEQTIVKKVHLRFEGCGGIHTDTKEAVLSAGFSEYGKEEHTGREEKVEGMNSGKGSHPEILKRKGLFLAAEVFLNSPAGEIKSPSGDELIFGIGVEIGR